MTNMKIALPVVIVLSVAMAPSLMAEPVVSIPDDILGITGEVAMAPVLIDDATDVLSFGFDITYNHMLLNLGDDDIKAGSLTASGWTITPFFPSDGLVKVSGYTANPLTNVSGSLLELDFHVIGTSGTSVLGISGTLTGDTPSFDPGSISIVPEPSIIASLLGLFVAAGFVFTRRR